MRRFVKTWWKTWKNEKENSKQRTTDHRCHFVLPVLDWKKPSGEEVQRFQGPNQIQLLMEIKLWITVTWMDENLGRHQDWHLLSLLSPSPALCHFLTHTHTFFIYLFRLWVCICFWERSQYFAITMVTQQSLPSVWFRLPTELTLVHAGVGGWLLMMTASEGGVEQKLWMHEMTGSFRLPLALPTVAQSRDPTPGRICSP